MTLEAMAAGTPQIVVGVDSNGASEFPSGIEVSGEGVKTEGFSQVVEGSFWIVLGILTVNLGGIVFWVLVGALAGAGALGYATAAFSIAGMLASLGNLGLGYAVLREVPTRGPKAYSASLFVATGLGLCLSALSVTFSGLYGGFLEYLPFVAAMTVLGLVAVTSISALVASLNAKYVFATDLASTLVRLAGGVALLAAGLGGLGIVAALLSAQVVVVTLSTLLTLLILDFAPPELDDIVEVLKIGISNYPQVLSTQLIVSAGVVLVALLTGSPEGTGIFYMALMGVLALTMVPGAMAVTSLPLMVKTNDHKLASESLRIGGGAVLPLAIAAAVAAEELLSLVNPEFAAGSQVLALLTLAVIPQAAILAGISKLNSERELSRIFAVGIIRLVALLALMVALLPRFGVLGAALAFVASAAAPLPLLRGSIELKSPAKLFALQVLILLAAFRASPLLGPVPASALAALVTAAALHATGLLRLGEVVEAAKVILKSI